jgi:hypothetical protein
MKADINKYPKLKEVSTLLGVDPFWLWVVIQHESGWNPRAVNPSTGASGLIQFMPSTAKSLGASPATILLSGVNSQLDLVYKYLLPYKGKMKDIDDVYFAVFYPKAIGKPNSYILGIEKGKDYAQTVAMQNPANNPNRDNMITVGEVKRIIRNKAKAYGYNPFQELLSKLKTIFKTSTI